MFVLLSVANWQFFCFADRFFNSGFLCTRQLWRNVVMFDAATHSFRCGVCAFQELGMSVAQANGQLQWRQASGSKRSSFHGVRPCTATIPVSRGSQKSTAEPVGKDYPDVGDHSNMLQTPHGGRDARTSRPGDKRDRRATEARLLLQVRPGPSPMYLGRALFCPSTAGYPCFFGMRALTVGEKLTSLLQLQGPSTL